MKTVDYLKVQELIDIGYTWDMIKDEYPDFSDTDRKRYYGFRDAFKLFDKRLKDNRYTEREQNLRLERKMLGYERSINNEQIRDIALHKTLSNQMIQALRNTTPLEFGTTKPNVNRTSKEYVAVMSDEHYNGDKINFKDVLEGSMNQLIDKVEREGIGRLTLVIGGDVIEGAGNLRASQAQAVKSGMIKQMVEAQAMYAQMLSQLSHHVNLKVVIVTSSNHTQLRLMGSKQNELVEEDLMIMFAEYIKAVLPDLDIIAEQQPLIKVKDYNVKVMHGHTVSKNKFESEMANISSFEHTLIDFLILGHYHHLEEREISTVQKGNNIYDKKIILVPSLCQDRSNFEHDLKVSSIPAVGWIEFDDYGSNAIKLPVITNKYLKHSKTH